MIINVKKCSACGEDHNNVVVKDGYFLCPNNSIKVIVRNKETLTKKYK